MAVAWRVKIHITVISSEMNKHSAVSFYFLSSFLHSCFLLINSSSRLDSLRSRFYVLSLLSDNFTPPFFSSYNCSISFMISAVIIVDSITTFQRNYSVLLRELLTRFTPTLFTQPLRRMIRNSQHGVKLRKVKFR